MEFYGDRPVLSLYWDRCIHGGFIGTGWFLVFTGTGEFMAF